MERAKEFNIQLDDVAITHLSFGTEARPHGNVRTVPGGCSATAAFGLSSYNIPADSHYPVSAVHEGRRVEAGCAAGRRACALCRHEGRPGTMSCSPMLSACHTHAHTARICCRMSHTWSSKLSVQKLVGISPTSER